MIREYADFLSLKGCLTLSGPLQVAFSSDITDLEPLINLTSVTGADEHGNSIYIYKNENLENIRGLRNLKCRLKGALVVDNNDKLVSLEGLEGIRTIGQNLATDGIYIVSNPLLEDINALKNLAEPPMGNLRMWGNPALTEQARNSWHNMDTHYNTYEDRTQSPDPRFNAH